jgi:glutamyl-tRNA reductase
VREDLVLIGTSFRHVGFGRLGGYVLPPERSGELARLRELCGASELAYVATCNRVEIYLCRPAGPDVADLAARAAEFFAAAGAGADARAADFFVLAGSSAIEHLFSVVASLDSLVLGECEIAGQVRRAADTALASGLGGPFLRRTFEQAAKVAKKVRAETAIGRTPVSVASLVLRHAREHFRAAPPRRAVLIGVGDVTKKVGASLESSPTRRLFVNRTVSRAADLAERFGGEALSLDDFRHDTPPNVDWIVTATRAPGPVIDAALLSRMLDARGAGARAEPMLVCDLGVPADVDPAIAADPRVRLLRLDDLERAAKENRTRLEGEVERVKAIVAAEARRFATEARLRALAAESADAILGERLAHLAPEDRETVRRFATQLAERISRQPA